MRGAKIGSLRGTDLERASSVVGKSNELTAAYAMADNVSDEAFEAAIVEAKAEGRIETKSEAASSPRRDPRSAGSLHSHVSNRVENRLRRADIVLTRGNDTGER
jgi:hypothetical protein